MKDLSDQNHFGSTLRLKQVSAQKGKNLTLEDQFRRNSIINKRDLILLKEKIPKVFKLQTPKIKFNNEKTFRTSSVYHDRLVLIYDGCSA